MDNGSLLATIGLSEDEFMAATRALYESSYRPAYDLFCRKAGLPQATARPWERLTAAEKAGWMSAQMAILATIYAVAAR